MRSLGDSLGKVNITLSDESDLWKLVATSTVARIKDILSKEDAEKLLKRCTYEGDREADDFDLYSHIIKLGINFIIRSQHDRKITDKNNGEKYKISEFSEEEIEHGQPYKIEVLENGKIRTALVQRSVLKSYELNPPFRQQKNDSIIVSIVFVREINAPKSSKPIEWKILTSHPVKNEIDSQGIVVAYTKRWKIEELNKCSKTGVKLEERQFTEPEHLWPAIAITMVVAWRILYIRDIAQKEDDTDASKVFSKEEMDYFDAALEQNKIITVADAIDHIARLGGFRRSYAHPGWLILWRGWFKFTLRVQGFSLARSRPR